MRKLLLLLAAVALPFGAFAQKKYVNVVASGLTDRFQSITLSGDIPTGMKTFYDSYTDQNTLGNVVNQLVSLGLSRRIGFRHNAWGNSGCLQTKAELKRERG